MKILTAMSGGVDSSVAAALLLRDGHCVEGVTFVTSSDAVDSQDVRDARAACDALELVHHVLDISTEFDSCVKEYFVSAYEAGQTPNPCVVCNREIKFGLLLRWAMCHGFDAVASGHYARIIHAPDGRTRLYRARDTRKDQSYVLAAVGEEKLSRVVLPLGGYTKDEIRTIADSLDICTAHKKDSQDICFIPDGDYASFIERYRGVTHTAGNYITSDGELLGRHRGHMCYTVGQRRGLGIALGRHMFVLERRAKDNTVVLGDDSELMKREIIARDAVLIGCDALPERVSVRIRYSHRGAPARICRDGSDVRVVFDEPQRAPTPGQLAVFTCEDDLGERVLGSAVICRAGD